MTTADENARARTTRRLATEDPDVVVADLAADLRRARLALAAAISGLRQAAVLLIDTNKAARGLRTQRGFAAAAGVDRMTVRNWGSRSSEEREE